MLADSLTVEIPPGVDPVVVLGAQDQVLKALESNLRQVRILARGNIITVQGQSTECELAQELLKELITAAKHGRPLSAEAVSQVLATLDDNSEPRIIKTAPGLKVKAKTPGQAAYLKAMDQNRIIFGIGPAGTGKTYLAMAKAVEALKIGQVKRIILTRPAVEAGESLGYLPGSLTEKINPYLRPLYDALREMLEPDQLAELLDSGTIEVAPLAYMRGRTLSQAFIVLDEAQNTTSLQMKMFLTRLGQDSIMVVTGDVTQTDLPSKAVSGLKQAERILPGISQLKFCYLTSEDVVRDPIVGEIIDAYEQHLDLDKPKIKGHR